MVHHCARLRVLYTFVPPLYAKNKELHHHWGTPLIYYVNFNNMDLKIK